MSFISQKVVKWCIFF